MSAPKLAPLLVVVLIPAVLVAGPIAEAKLKRLWMQRSHRLARAEILRDVRPSNQWVKLLEALPPGSLDRRLGPLTVTRWTRVQLKSGDVIEPLSFAASVVTVAEAVGEDPSEVHHAFEHEIANLTSDGREVLRHLKLACDAHRALIAALPDVASASEADPLTDEPKQGRSGPPPEVEPPWTFAPDPLYAPRGAKPPS